MPAILEALAEHNVGEGRYRCKVGRWLDTIPQDEPGREELVAAFEAPPHTGRPTTQLAAIAARLEHPTSGKAIGEHRGRRCRCSW